MGKVVEMFPVIPDIVMGYKGEELNLSIEELVAFLDEDGEVPKIQLQAIVAVFLQLCADGVFSE